MYVHVCISNLGSNILLELGKVRYSLSLPPSSPNLPRGRLFLRALGPNSSLHSLKSTARGKEEEGRRKNTGWVRASHGGVVRREGVRWECFREKR